MNAQPTYSASLPIHIAIIMDGNGRWARARGKPRVMGHQAGVKTVRRIVEHAANRGIKYLTLYSFSTENWSRPKAEVMALFSLLKKYVAEDLESLHENGVRIRILGARDGLSSDLKDIINRVESKTRENAEFFLNIAFNYGGRDEILRAVKTAQDKGYDLSNLTSEQFGSLLDTHGVPDPDFVIRTSGEKRISNFLIWQTAYSEFYFTDVYWPDFDEGDFDQAIAEFQSRDRRFGRVDPAEVA